MTEVASAYVSLVPSARGFGRRLSAEVGPGVDQAGREGGRRYASGMSASVGAGLKGMFGFAAKGVAVFGGLAAAGAAVGLKTAAANEQAQISFTTMLGSAQKAGAFLKDLQAFAAATPFEFPELQTAASSLISAGINANKVIPIMRTLGDVTAGMGTGSEGIQRATVALQQMAAAGKISGEDLNQLRDAGIPVYDLLAKATGKSKAEVIKLAQAGKLGAKELGLMMTALETGKGLERFSGLMDKQSRSLTGMVSTFKDTLGQGLAKAMAPTLPIIKKSLGAASDLLGSTILPKFGAGVKKMATFVDVIRQSFGGAVTDTRGLSSGMSLLAIKIGYVFKTAGPFFRTIRDVINGGAKDTSGMNDKVALLAITIGAKLKKGIEVFKDFKALLPPILDSAKKLWPSIKEIATQLAAASKSGGVSTFDLLKAALGALPGILDTIAPLLKDVAKWMGDNEDIVSGLVVALGSATVAYKVLNGVVKAYTAVQTALNIVMDANPIGLVIIAIAALAGGLIYAYQHSEKFRKFCDLAFQGVAMSARWLWNGALAPVIRFMLNGFAAVARNVATFLHALSHVPGFGWAETAADKLDAAANKARELANGIKDIPARKVINVDIYARTRTTGRITLPNGSHVNVGARASGGPVRAGQPYIVGEKRPELFVPKQDGTIVPRVPDAAAAARSGGLSQADVLRIAGAMSQVQLQTTVSAGSFDRQMGARL